MLSEEPHIRDSWSRGFRGSSEAGHFVQEWGGEVAREALLFFGE